MNKKSRRQKRQFVADYCEQRKASANEEPGMTSASDDKVPASRTSAVIEDRDATNRVSPIPFHPDQVAQSPDRWLREEVWHAVVNHARKRKCWVHRTHGGVIAKSAVVQKYPEQFIEIPAFPQGADKVFARQFLIDEKVESSPGLLKAIDGDTPWINLPRKLRDIRWDLKDKYKTRRAAHIIASHIEPWRTQHKIGLDIIYEPFGVKSLSNRLSPEEERCLGQEIEEATLQGQRAVVAYGYSRFSSHIVLLLADLPLLPFAFRMIDDEYVKSQAGRAIDRYHLGFHFNDPAVLDKLASTMNAGLSTAKLTLHNRTRRLVVRKIRRSGASHYMNKGFGLIDICGFSVMTPAQQLQALLVLNLAIKQAGVRMRGLCRHLRVEDDQFARVSTGDGFYLWHVNSSNSANTAVFVYMLATLAQIQLLRCRGKTDIRVKAAFTIGEVYTFYEVSLEAGICALAEPTRQNAVGPATNELARLIAGSRPGQFVLGDFERSVRAGVITAKTLVSQVRAALLPLELERSDKQWFQSTELLVDPADRPLLITDKHGDSFRCWNVHGTVQAWVPQHVHSPSDTFAADVGTDAPRFHVHFLRVGLEPETARPMDRMAFKSEPFPKIIRESTLPAPKELGRPWS